MKMKRPGIPAPIDSAKALILGNNPECRGFITQFNNNSSSSTDEVVTYRLFNSQARGFIVIERLTSIGNQPPVYDSGLVIGSKDLFIGITDSMLYEHVFIEIDKVFTDQFYIQAVSKDICMMNLFLIKNARN